jgi:hypothetical protein
VTPSSIRIPAPGAGSSAQRQGIGSTTFQLATPTPKATNVAGATASPCGSPGGGPAPGGAPAGPPASPAGPAVAGAKGPLLQVSGGSGLTIKGGAVTVRLRCVAGGAPCNGRATLRTAGSRAAGAAARQTTLGTAAVRITAGSTAAIRIRLSGPGRKLVRKARRVRARLTVVLTGAPPVSRAVVLRRGS